VDRLRGGGRDHPFKIRGLAGPGAQKPVHARASSGVKIKNSGTILRLADVIAFRSVILFLRLRRGFGGQVGSGARRKRPPFTYLHQQNGPIGFAGLNLMCNHVV
jgi:hypothetical protein